MPWNMFSRFGDGSDSDIVGFGELEKAIRPTPGHGGRS